MAEEQGDDNPELAEPTAVYDAVVKLPEKVEVQTGEENDDVLFKWCVCFRNCVSSSCCLHALGTIVNCAHRAFAS